MVESRVVQVALSPPSHGEVRLALASTDAELDQWTRSPDDYSLLEDASVDIPDCRAWLVVPAGVATPVGVRLVEADGGLTLTTQRPEAIARLLERHPPRWGDLPRAFFHLWRDPGRPVEAIPDSDRVRRTDDGWELELEGIGSTNRLAR